MNVTIYWDKIGEFLNCIGPIAAIAIGFAFVTQILKMVQAGIGSNDDYEAERLDRQVLAEARVAAERMWADDDDDLKPPPAPEPEPGRCRYCGQRVNGNGACAHCGAPQ